MLQKQVLLFCIVVLYWISCSASYSHYRSLYTIFPKVLVTLFEMLDGHQDHDLETMATQVISKLFKLHCLPDNLLIDIITTLNGILASDDWIKKLRVLSVYQSFIFNHLFWFLNNGDLIDQLFDIFTNCLLDSRIEVAQIFILG